jgi:methionine synthase I (cobalamin-dependent)
MTTNTFGANRFRLAHRGLADYAGDFNRAAARLTSTVADDLLVAGCIGPSGTQAALSPAVELRAAFREQALALVEGGVDLLLCETFGDVGELRAAVLGIRDVSGLPIVASMSYGEDGRTLTGEEPAAVVESLGDLEITAIGANCCIGATTVEKVIAALHDLTSLPLVVRPNAGSPRLTAGSWRYPVGPREFAKLIAHVSSASWLVGGCCGTTPAHISAVHALWEKYAGMRDS